MRMTRLAWLAALGPAVLAPGGPGLAQPANRSLDEGSRAVWNRVEGPYAAAIFRQAQRMDLPCADGNGQCSLGRLADEVEIHASNETPAPRHVIAAISYGGGSAMMREILLSERRGGAYRYRARLSGLYGTGLKATFEGSTATFRALTLRPDDARCCPQGETVYEVDLASGRVRHVSGNRPRG